MPKGDGAHGYRSCKVESNAAEGTWLMMGKILDALKPNTASLGFGMFIAVNSSGIWGEVASLMPPDIKGTELSLPLYALYAVLFAICCFGWTAASFRFRFGSDRPSVWFGVISYAGGWFLLAVHRWMVLDGLAMMAAAALFVSGMAAMFVLWQRVFAAMEADDGNRGLIVGSAIAAVAYLLVDAVAVRWAPSASAAGRSGRYRLAAPILSLSRILFPWDACSPCRLR